ncbi:AAA family ATPase [Pseudomonas syringae]|uniref:AAA family ATPase n=1 Tax=Pseudomonas syringae TaxID=317 RepID=UPI0004196F51|nr:AAA family ATPase [Pseudomonas syringae]
MAVPNVNGLGTPVTDDFEAWLGERSRWLQTAAKNLIETKKPPTDDQITELARLCIVESKKEQDSGFSTVTPSSLALAANRPAIRIEGISEVHGLNAIKPGASLPFGPGNITVFYGQNGSGKSGYARLLKQACGSRSKDEIHPNVFVEEPVACSAKFQVSAGENQRTIDWTLAQGADPLLRHAQIFDTKTANQYMGKSEASYEPSQMKFVASLIAVSDKVSQHLAASKNALLSALPQFPANLGVTDESRWLASLKPTTTNAAIDKACLFTQELDADRIATEGALAQKDIAGRLASINKEKQGLASVRSAMSQLKEKLSEDVAKIIVSAHSDAKLKRQAAQKSAQQLFAETPLEGVGEAVWQQLWAQARLFSQTHAYPDQPFPVIGEEAKCVLCQQELNEDASTRLLHFEQFVTEGLERAAKEAEGSYQHLLRAMPPLPDEQGWQAHMALLKLEQQQANDLYIALLKRRTDLDTAEQTEEISAFDWSPVDQALAVQTEQLAIEEKSLSDLLQDGKRQQMEDKLRKLRGVQWLAQNKPAILAERDRLLAVDLYGKAIRLTATNTLTSKNNDLAKSEVEAGYQTRFAAELKLLGGSRLPVAPQSKTVGKGRTTFGLTLVGAKGTRPPEQILSEGETRIVALAAFLADITGSNQVAPFIFDDPISSLDQDFEERVVARLVDLAQTRQVIIFTHRLSLITLLDSAVKKVKDHPDLPDVLHIVQTLRRLDKTSGILTGQSARDSKPKSAINKLLKETLPRLKKHQTEGDVDSYDIMAKSVCSDFRIIVERTVEVVMLNNVVLRFRREVMTKGLLRQLSNITQEDCDLIDDLMTRYSVYEHSQADDLPAVPPELVQLEADMQLLADWMENYAKRVA